MTDDPRLSTPFAKDVAVLLCSLVRSDQCSQVREALILRLWRQALLNYQGELAYK
jgi:hypothetical protein